MSKESDEADDFTQFQLKEYENISQAHFKTNEVLATFYRYFLLITAIPITAIGVAIMNLSGDVISNEGRYLAQVIFGVSTLLLSVVGAAVIAYIEGLRLDAILYARVVNSIRDYFFRLPAAEKFGEPVLPTNRNRPSYRVFGAGFIIYFACAAMNATYFGVGIFVLMLNHSTLLVDAKITCKQWIVSLLCFGFMLMAQGLVRQSLIAVKEKNGI